MRGFYISVATNDKIIFLFVIKILNGLVLVLVVIVQKKLTNMGHHFFLWTLALNHLSQDTKLNKLHIYAVRSFEIEFSMLMITLSCEKRELYT